MEKDLIQQLMARIEKLEKNSIQVQMSPESKEQMKNGVFEGFYQSDQTVPSVSGSTPYLKMIWKNKIIYIPYYK